MSGAFHSFRHTTYTTHHSDFIKQFTDQEIQEEKEKKKKPKPLTNKERAVLQTQLERKRSFTPGYADNTKINISNILPKWKRFCEHMDLSHWKQALFEANQATIMNFVDWVCEEYQITSEGSSWVYFREWKQLYQKETGKTISWHETKEIKKFHDTVVARRHRLRKPNMGADGKPTMGTNGLYSLLRFNIGYDTKIFPVEGHRVQLAGCWILLATTGARPAEIVDHERKPPKDGCHEELWSPGTAEDANEDDNNIADDDESRVLEKMLRQETVDRGRPKALCYEDIKLMVVCHPETGQHVLCMAIKFIHHKGGDNKPKPTIFFFTMTRRIIFCPITIIISIALRDKAFSVDLLNSAQNVFRIKAVAMKPTALHWKECMLKIPVFRQYMGAALSPNRPLQYYILRDESKRVWEDAGNEEHFTLKVFRRMAANGINGKAPDTVRDQAMRHNPKWAIFNSAYINEKIQFHVQNAILDEPLEDELLQFWSHMGMTCDPRATKHMVPVDVWKNMPPNAEIINLQRELLNLKGSDFRIEGRDNEKDIRQLAQKIRSKKSQWTKKVQATYRQYYFQKSSNWEVERQLRGEVEADEEGEEGEEEYVRPAINLHIPERAEVAEILVNQDDDLSPEKLNETRIRVIELMTKLNQKRETVKRKRIPQKGHAGLAAIEELSVLDSFPLLMKNTQCPECIGDARLSYYERIFEYCRDTVMKDHFDKEHLKAKELAERDNELIPCMHPRCQEVGETFSVVDEYRNHVKRVHTITLRTSERVALRRAKKAKHRRK